MWSVVNKLAEELHAHCSAQIEQTRRTAQEASNEIKSNNEILTSLALEDEDPEIKRTEFEADVIDRYQDIVAAANDTIGRCVSGLEDMEVRMRRERVEAVLLGGRRFPETTFRSARSACIKMHNVYACGFLDKMGKVTFVDKSYPLVSESVFLTGVQLGFCNGGRELVVRHLNYAVFDDPIAANPPKVYRDECAVGNEVVESLPAGRLSESCMNDTKEFSSSFEIEVLTCNKDTAFLSIAINMGPRLYDSVKGFEYTGPVGGAETPTKAREDNEASSADDEDTSDSSTKNDTPPPTYYKPSDDPATRSADRMLSEEFSYTRDLHKVLVSIQKKGEWDEPLLIDNSKPSSFDEPLKTSPVLEGLSKVIGHDRERALAASSHDTQKAIAKVLGWGTHPKKLAVTNVLEGMIDSGYRHERDLNIAKSLLEDEDYGTKYAMAITKELMSSARGLGGMGLDHTVRNQKNTIEGMRSDCGWGNRHTTLESLRQEELAEAIRDLLCTEFGAKMTASDAKVLKSKPYYTLRQNLTLSPEKKRRVSPEKREGVAEKKRKLEAGSIGMPSTTGEEEEEGSADDIITVPMGTVIPPPLCGEPREIASTSAMTEMLAEYSSVIARYIAKSPMSSIRLASVIDVIFTLKRTLSGKITRKSANTVTITPVVIDDKESICSKMYAKLMARDTKGMEYVMRKHKAGESAENGMRALLTMRRLSEERNAYRHLVEVLILENVVGILSGEGVTYSSALYNAAVWYIKVVIRNRICGNRGLVDKVGAYITEVCLQVNAALDWLFKFNIDHKLLLERDIVSDRAFADLAPSRDIEPSLFKPGERFYALIEGEDTLPMKMVKMPAPSSVLKIVGVFNTRRNLDDYMFCINNYGTGNMFLLSGSDINTVGNVGKLVDDDRNQLCSHQRWRQDSPYLFATPSFQLARDTRKLPLFGEIVSGGRWDELAGAPRGAVTRIFEKPSKGRDMESSSMTMPFLLCGSYKDAWKNLPLFCEAEGGVFQFRYEANTKGRLMTSMIDQALSAPQEKKGLGATLTRVANIIDFYTKKDPMDTRSSHTMSRVCLTVYWTPAGGSAKGEEVGRFDCTHSGDTNLDAVDLHGAVDLYDIRGPKNIGRWKRFVATGSTEKAVTSVGDGVDGEGEKKRKAKRDGEGSDKYAIRKLPKHHVLLADAISHANVAPFMLRMYNIVRQGQNIRERCLNKINSTRSKSVGTKRQ